MCSASEGPADGVKDKAILQILIHRVLFLQKNFKNCGRPAILDTTSRSLTIRTWSGWGFRRQNCRCEQEETEVTEKIHHPGLSLFPPLPTVNIQTEFKMCGVRSVPILDLGQPR